MDSTRIAVRERDDRLARVVGRTARLELSFERRGAATRLVRAYVEPPFSVRRAFEIDDAAYVIIVCSGPGVFGGDDLRQSIHVGPGAKVALTSQSSLQVHPSGCDLPAAIAHHYTLDDDAELHCDWDPVIPFAASRLAQRFEVHMPSSARLWWSDAVMTGRVGRGERWRFNELAHELRLEVDGMLQYLERYRIAPAERRVNGRWIAADNDYFGTALARHPSAGDDLAEALHREMLAVAGIQGAVDVVRPSLIAARCASAYGVPFAAARAACRRLVLDRLFESPSLGRRKSV